MEELTMKTLRNFTDKDFYEYQANMSFPDGTNPMIAEGDNAILLVGGWQDCNGGFGISLIFDEDNCKDLTEAFKYYDDVKRAISDAKLFAQLLDCDLTKEFLSDFGFEVI